jgi:aminoglycoside N3'-acetyltransferase
MSEKKRQALIERTTAPLTVAWLAGQLRACGLAEAQTVLVHMAMSKLGYVIGGAQAVILALIAAVGETGTSSYSPKPRTIFCTKPGPS